MHRRLFVATAVACLASVLAVAHDDHANPFVELPRDVRGTPRQPTYHRHVAKILERHCTTCHREGDIAPMALDDYAAASAWIDVALEEIGKGNMPPWRPTRGVGLIEGERGLSDREIATLVRWSEQGGTEGSARRRRAPSDGAGWLLGEPDAVLQYGEAFTVPGSGEDIYRCFPIATDFDDDVYVRALDVQPGDRRVAHHVVLYIDETGESHDLDDAEPGPGYICFGGPGTSGFGTLPGAGDAIAIPASPVLGGWAPGNRPTPFPRDHGVRIPKGATVIMQLHYHPLPGDDVLDASKVGLYLSKSAHPQEVFLLPVLNDEFTIPAGDPAYEVTADLDPRALLAEVSGLDIAVSGRILSVLPHMHLLGRSIEVDVGLPDGTSQRLVEIPDWSFDWQDTYQFDRSIPVPLGSTVHLRCVFDNSAGNALNPNTPPVPVSWGERTVDEMALAFVALTFQFPDEVLDLFDLIGFDPPHRRGLRPVRASKPPEVRRVRVVGDALEVVATRLEKGGRIEIAGVAVEDSMTRRTRRRLTSASGWASAVAPGQTVDVRVRRADGRLSPPFPYTR